MQVRVKFTYNPELRQIMTEGEIEEYINDLKNRCAESLRSSLIENLSEHGLKPEDMDIQIEVVVAS